MAVLAAKGLTKRFGPNEVLRNVSLAVDAHEIRAICGENGARARWSRSSPVYTPLTEAVF